MQYMILIYAAENAHPGMGTPEGEAYMGKYFALSQEYADKNIIEAGAPLENVDSATTVRVQGGKTETTDGPFAETREQLGGYYLLNCENLDQALEFAAKIPTAEIGSIEVRPVRDMGGAPE